MASENVQIIKKEEIVFFIKNANFSLFWRAETNIYHISWIYCISAAYTFTKYMFVSTCKLMDPDFKSTFLLNFGEFVWSPKGYLVQNNMIQWVQEI